MFLLVAGVEFCILRLFILEHTEEDFEQSLSQTSQRTRMTHALVAFLLIVGRAPGAGFAKTIGPEMNGMAQELVARPPNADFVELARLIGYRRSPRDCLQHFLAAVAIRIITHRREQARR